MQSIFVTDKGQIGFGESVEEAQEDLYDKLCILIQIIIPYIII